MKNNRPILAVVTLCSVVSFSTLYGMGMLRAWESNHVCAPPPTTVTNAPTPAPVPPAPTTPAPAPAPSNPFVLASVKWQSFPMLKVSYSGISGWPTDTGSNGKTVIGILQVNGKKVEWFKPGQTAISVVNATVVGGKYYQSIPHGATVTITLTDIHQKQKTNPLEIMWP